MYDCGKSPRDYIRPIEPQNAIAKVWIPQTMADQIWVVWKFNTKEERDIFEASLPPNVSRWIDRSVIKHALCYMKDI